MPKINSVSPQALPTVAPAQLTITGKDLDRIKTITLVNDKDSTKKLDGTINNQDKITAQTESINVTFDVTKIKDAVGDGAHIEFVTKDDDTSQQPDQIFKITIQQ